MSPSELAQERPLAEPKSFFDLFKKYMPRCRSEKLREQPWADLERLALSAPHVLADIGFERDLVGCNPDQTVWRRGSICVAISTTARSVSISAN